MAGVGRPVAAAVVATLVLLGGAGCGDDPLADRIEEDGVQAYDDAEAARAEASTTTSSTTTTTVPGSTADPVASYVEAGTTICGTLTERLRASLDVEVVADLLVTYREMADSLRRAADSLEILAPPVPDWQASLDEGISAMRSTANHLMSMADALRQGAVAAAQGWARSARGHLERATTAFLAAGLPSCG